ncbi:MAG: hypothetical protein SOR56_05725 [Oscillospiraceae bacterium]|nr:hypothetical protein [Oscillospiraceae bacterium]
MAISILSEILPSGVEPDFIPAGDFIIEDDFTHTAVWISLKRNSLCLQDKGCSFSGPSGDTELFEKP